MRRIGNDPRPGRASVVAEAAATEDLPPAAAGRSPRFAVRRPALAWGGGLLLAGIGLFTLYLRQSQLAPFNADGAAQTLQAWDMLHGNPLLKGWWVTDVSFYTTELPEYMLVEVFRGMRPDVVHISGALGYTLTVLFGALLARGQARGRAGLVRALLAAGIMLAPGITGGTEVFLENPDHAGTAVPILALLLLLDRAPERWYVPVAVCGLLAWIQVGDQLTLVAATAPIAGVAVVRLAMLALRRRPVAEFRYDAMLLAAAVLSYELANLAQAAMRALGGYYLRSLPQQLLAPMSQARANARVMRHTITLLFGANIPSKAHQPLGIIAQFHLIGLALAAAGLAMGIALFCTSRTDRVSQILVAAILATLVAGVFGTLLQSLANAHEVAILLPLGAALAGRMLPPLVPARLRPGRVVVPLVAVWLAGGLAALCYAATWAPIGPPNQALVNWLVSHHYREGLAAYWQANSSTVVSGGRVLVAPVKPSATAVRRWNSSIDWYDARHRTANFIIAVDPGAGTGGLSTELVREHFGSPAHRYVVGRDVVMVYNCNVLTRLSGRVFPGVELETR